MASRAEDRPPHASPHAPPDIRHDWTRAEAESLFALPLNELLYRAHGLHRRYFDANEVQLSTLLNVKDGGCPEDCKYCAQSARYESGFKAKKLMALDEVVAKSTAAKAAGAGQTAQDSAKAISATPRPENGRGPRDRPGLGDKGPVSGRARDEGSPTDI